MKLQSFRLFVARVLRGSVYSRELKNVFTHLTPDYTMVRKPGLKNIQKILKIIKRNNIEGDFVETGVWRGGACMFARAMMNELDMKGIVYACDSFCGLPSPNKEKYPVDTNDRHHTREYLKVSKKEVMDNFERFKLSVGVVLVEGLFKNTMPELKNRIKSISILRLDGDMYESTIQVLENLYDLVSPGGFIIIDDYGLQGAKKAVDDFRKSRGIKNRIKSQFDIKNAIYGHGYPWYWQKSVNSQAY